MRWLTMVLVCLWTGCAGGLLDRAHEKADDEEAAARAEELEERSRKEAPDLEQLTTRGRFDLACSDAALTVLERHANGPAILVGLQGCGRQVQYSRKLRRDVKWGTGLTTRNTHWDKVPGSQVAIASGNEAPPPPPRLHEPRESTGQGEHGQASSNESAEPGL